jgi:hypothetical protein
MLTLFAKFIAGLLLLGTAIAIGLLIYGSYLYWTHRDEGTG